MNEQNEIYLVETYPKLYRQYHLTRYQSPMGRGFECGDGWFYLLDMLSKELSQTNITIEAAQVKSKFGMLRYYTDKSYDENDPNIDEKKYQRESSRTAGAISFAEQISIYTCERCGKFDNKRKLKNNDRSSWVFNRCDACWEKIK